MIKHYFLLLVKRNTLKCSEVEVVAHISEVNIGFLDDILGDL